MRYQIKVTTCHDNVKEVEFFQADSKEEIDKIYNELMENKSENEFISEPFPVS